MITADTLKTLTTFTSRSLAAVVNRSGYTGTVFKTAQFLGMTNGGEFCYRVTYWDDAGTGEETGKVFVKVDESGEVVAEY